MDTKLIIKRFYDLAKEVLADDEVGCSKISITFGDALNVKEKLTVDIQNTDMEYFSDDEKDKDISLHYHNEYWSINTSTDWMSYADFEAELENRKIDRYTRIGIISLLN